MTCDETCLKTLGVQVVHAHVHAHANDHANARDNANDHGVSTSENGAGAGAESGAGTDVTVRDLWLHSTIGTVGGMGGRVTVAVPGGGASRLLRLVPTTGMDSTD